MKPVLYAVHPAIRSDDDAILRTLSEPVENFHDAEELIALMFDVLRQCPARGLAAIQVGVPLRVFMALDGQSWRVMINPRLDRTLNRFTTEREGCLSIPGRRWGDVSRPAKCDATWFDIKGARHSHTLTGELARIFQHEFDHLNGVLMTDRMAEIARPANVL